MKKRIFSLLMALTLCLSLLPTMALAGVGSSVDVTWKEVFSGSGKSTVTLKGTIPDDNGGTKNVVLHFELNVEYESGEHYSTGESGHITTASAEIGGVNAGKVTEASLTVTKAKSGGAVEIDATVNMEGTKNYSLFARWDNYQKHDGIKFEPWMPSKETPLPTEAGNYYLYGDVTLTDTWTAPTGTTNLCLNGHVIKMTGTGSVIKIPANATLNLYDCNEGNHVYKFVDEDWKNGYPYTYWKYNSEYSAEELKEPIELKDGEHIIRGGCITGGTGTDKDDNEHLYGGGVFVAAGGEFVFKGGNIVGNTAVDSSNAYSKGGGVYVESNLDSPGKNNGTFTIPANCDEAKICGNLAVDGGGVANYGSFTMDSGWVNCNTAMFGAGGGVYACEQFTMNGGRISDNYAVQSGGGVSVQGTAFTMNGGSISDNTANNWGGGVYSGGDEARFTMTGGGISDNKAENGGGVFGKGGAVTVTGGSITDNIAKEDNGGVYVDTKTTVTLGGTAQITDNYKATNYGKETETLTENNLYLPEDLTITLGDNSAVEYPGTGTPVPAPASGMLVGVTTQTAPTTGTPVVIATSGATSGDDDRFFSDAGYSVSQSEGQLQIDDGYPIKLGDTPITMANENDVLGDGTVSYAPATKTLTLNNAKITTLGVGENIAILSKLHDDLTINLNGNNQIGEMKVAQPTSMNDYTVGIGISSVNSGVTLTGSGSLTMYTGTTGIRATDVNISSKFTGALTIENYGVNFDYKGVFISDMPAIRADNNVGVRGGTLNVTSRDSGGIYAREGNIVIEGKATKVNVTSDKFSGIKAAPGTMLTDEDSSYYAGGGSVHIYDGAKVTVSAGEKVDELITDVYGIFAAGGVKIGSEDEGEAPEVTVTAGNANVSNVEDGCCEVCGIMSKNRDTTIYDAKVSVTAKGTEEANRTGIQTCKELSINGGTTTVTSDGQGITVAQNVSITDGEVSITSKGSGITGETGSIITISGGTVNATSNEGNGILAYGSVVITGDKTKVTADGATMGIVGKSVAIEGGTVNAKGATAIQGGTELVINTDKLEILNVNEAYTAGTTKTLTGKDGGYVTIQKKQPAPSGGGDYTPTVTVPVAGDKDSVKISATVSGSAAKIKNVTAEQLDKVGTGKEVTVDLSSLNKSVTGVTFPKTTLENIAESEASGLEVKLPGGTTAVFDKTTVAAIAEQAAGSDIQLVVDTTVKAAQVLTGAQKSAIQGMKSALVLEAYFTSNGKRISDFKGGEAELTVSYPTTKPVRVWYLTEEGALEEVPSSFDGKSASFVVKHFSNYVIEQLDGSSYASCPQDATCVYAKFTDANTRAWYHDGVHYCVENGMMNGVGNDLFAPGATLTRGMVVTMLARLSGVDTATNGVWYVPGQEWAVANGISDGTNMTANITREQLATMLYRYALLKGVDTAKFTENTNTLSYDDVFTISDWAASGMHFCIAAGVVNGDNNGMLNPGNTATRAEAATMFQRLGEKVLAK